MLYGTMHDSAILTASKKIARKSRKAKRSLTPAEEALQTYILVGTFWYMLTWARFAKLFAVVLLVVGFVLDGFTGVVVAYVLASPIGGLVFLSRLDKGRW